MIWKNHVVQYPNRYQMSKNSDGTLDLLPAFGNVIQEGTQLNAENLNGLENRIADVANYVNDVSFDISTQANSMLATLIWMEKLSNTDIPTTPDVHVDGFINQDNIVIINGTYDAENKCIYVI